MGKTRSYSTPSFQAAAEKHLQDERGVRSRRIFPPHICTVVKADKITLALSCIMSTQFKEAKLVAHRVETTLQQDGRLLLDNLPFHAGEAVEIIILAAPVRAQQQHHYPLRGTPIQYDRPFEPVAQDEWDAV